MTDKNIGSSMDDILSVEPSSKRSKTGSEQTSTPSLNQRAYDSLLFDWSKNWIPDTTRPNWDAAIVSFVAHERPSVPRHPRSAFEQFQEDAGHE